MRNVAIYANISKKNAVDLSDKLKIILKNKNINYLYNEEIINFKGKIDFLCCIGGDGTFLKAASIIYNRNIPIIGINTGTVGFLMQITPDETEHAIELLLNNNYEVENRMFLLAKLFSKNKKNFKEYFALNEIFVNRKLSSRILNISVKINNIKVDNINGDGIMVSTPTGSTAYSLSCGGTIISPSLKCFQIVPVNSHSLHSRALIVDHNDIIELKVKSKNNDICFIVDGKQKVIIDHTVKIIIQRSEYFIPFIVFNKNSFYKVLPKKVIFQSFEEDEEKDLYL